ALGTGVQLGTGLALGAGGYAERRPGVADDVVALAVLARLHLIDLIGRRDPGGDEVMLQPGDPTTLDRFAKALVVHVTHGDLGVGLVLGPERSTQVSRGAGCSARGRIATAVTFELAEHVAGPGLAALVIDQIADVQVVIVTLETETLDVVDAVCAVGQIDDQLVFTFGKLILLLRAAVERATAGLIRAVANQTALRHVKTLAAAFEKLEWNIGVILTPRKLRQMQFDNVATAWVDGHVQYIRADPNEFFARCTDGRQGTGLL